MIESLMQLVQQRPKMSGKPIAEFHLLCLLCNLGDERQIANRR